MRFGWTAESFLEALEEKLWPQARSEPDVRKDRVPDDIYRDHIGIVSQRQPGLSSVGASVLRGRVTGDQLLQLADFAEAVWKW